MKEIYKQLTGVDIQKQKMIYDERGKGYYGEYLLFCELYKKVSGKSKILMNLNIPVDSKKTTEIDLLLIHETGLYVFEVKHFKGTIYGKGNDTTWTQYFRTRENSIFKNPIEQNRYHIEALKSIFPNLPINSFIVFTNEKCDLRVESLCEDINVCTLEDVSESFTKIAELKEHILSEVDIDELFCQLSVYSQMQEIAEIDGEEASFISWVCPVVSGLENVKEDLAKEKKRMAFEHSKSLKELEQEKAEVELKMKKSTRNQKVFCVLFALVCVFVSVFLIISIGIGYSAASVKNDEELSKFKQNFLHIDEIDNEYIDDLSSYVEVSNVELSPLTDDAVSFTARLEVKNDVYGIMLTENSRYIVMTESGKVFEYNVFGEHLGYNVFNNRLYRSKPYGDLALACFYGISNIDDINYIKITDIDLFKDDLKRTTIKDELEIELYSKQ